MEFSKANVERQALRRKFGSFLRCGHCLHLLTRSPKSNGKSPKVVAAVAPIFLEGDFDHPLDQACTSFKFCQVTQPRYCLSPILCSSGFGRVHLTGNGSLAEDWCQADVLLCYT